MAKKWPGLAQHWSEIILPVGSLKIFFLLLYFSVYVILSVELYHVPSHFDEKPQTWLHDELALHDVKWFDV
jgi:hypothetical protein